MINITIEGSGKGMETVLKLANAYAAFDKFVDENRINPNEQQIKLLKRGYAEFEEIEKLVNKLRIIDI